MSKPVTIRLARPSDLANLLRLEQQTFAGDRMSAQQYRRHIHSSSANVLVAEQAGALLGNAIIFFAVD